MNFNQAPEEYDLHGNLTTEIINLYGVKLKLILAAKINIDDIVFGDYSHLKTIPNESYELYGLPEDTEGFISQGSSFSQFGLFGLDNINIFVSRKAIIDIIPTLDDTKGFGNIMGSLIVLPSGKLMEITEQLFADGNPGGVKVVLAQKKITQPTVRLPLVEPNDVVKAKLKKIAY